MQIYSSRSNTPCTCVCDMTAIGRMPTGIKMRYDFIVMVKCYKPNVLICSTELHTVTNVSYILCDALQLYYV